MRPVAAARGKEGKNVGKTHIIGGMVATEEGLQRADLLLENGVIADLAPAQAAVHGVGDVVDATGRLILPGGVDVHTHLDSHLNGAVTADDFRSGTIAAACGGTTTIIDFSPQIPGHTLHASLAAHRARAEGRAAIDYGLHQCVTDLEAGSLEELPGLLEAGVASVKAFMAYRGTLMLEDNSLRELFVAAAALGIQVCLHAEDGDAIDELATQHVSAGLTGAKGHHRSRPPKTEVDAVRRAIAMIRETGAAVYFVHISTAGAVREIARARAEGLDVMAETCTHYLVLDEEVYDQDEQVARGYIIAPPLRDAREREALWEALRTGALSVVSSDHCPYCLSEKNSPAHADFRTVPNGAPGIEHRMLVLYSHGVHAGRITIEEYVRLTAANPARRFGIYPQKGTIAVGSDADLVILDPAGHTVINQTNQHQRVDYSPYHDWKVHGRIERVYSKGVLVSQDGSFVGEVGRGRYLQRYERAK